MTIQVMAGDMRAVLATLAAHRIKRWSGGDTPLFAAG